MDGKDYSLAIAKLRIALTGQPNPGNALGTIADLDQRQDSLRQTRLVGPGNMFYVDHAIAIAGSTVTLVYKLDDLYIQGFVTSGGRKVLFKGSTASNVATHLPYGSAYGNLGWNRLTARTVTLAQVETAMEMLNNYRLVNPDGLKNSLVTILIAFAEAIRFDDVVEKIIKGEPISDLDWDQHELPGAVRVVKHPDARTA